MDNYGNDYNQQSYNGPQLEPPMSLVDWIITLVITAIPCVNIIMLFVWGFSQGGNTSRKNYCRAVLIVGAIGFVLGLILYSTIFAAFVSNMSELRSFY
jgi:uncharacterized membrane protein